MKFYGFADPSSVKKGRGHISVFLVSTMKIKLCTRILTATLLLSTWMDENV